MDRISRWSNRFNFVMAATGAAVGLGAIWKFPYMAGKNGGGAFVLVTIAAILLIAMPIMIAEILLGKIGRANPTKAMARLAKQNHASPHWQLLGWWGASALVLILAFYSVIAGWSIAYIFKLWGGQLSNLNEQNIILLWRNFLASPWQLLLWHSTFMLLTLGVVARGLKQGLEQASKIMMPGLFVVLLILMIYSLIIGDFSQTIDFLFTPDFSKLTPSVFLDALGQAFFSLAIGAGCMLVYGGYLPGNSKIIPNVTIISSLVILVSILSGLTIFPLVFSYNLSPTQGPGLMFSVLPIAFNNMPFGTFFGGLFFFMLLFAAWTSSISMAEPLVVLLIENFKKSRLTASIIVGSISWFIGAIAMLSFNLLQDFKIFGRWDIFSAIVDFASNIILPTGALGFAIFAGWVLNVKSLNQELAVRNKKRLHVFLFLLRYISPFGILFIFAGQFRNFLY